MTPKEKALELCKTFHNAPANDELIDGINWQMARECALIAVDEILKGDHLIRTPLSFWNQVKTEIEKL